MIVPQDALPQHRLHAKGALPQWESARMHYCMVVLYHTGNRKYKEITGNSGTNI